MIALAPGTHLGRYRLVAHLGGGGGGEVWEAELQGPGEFRKAVALKLLAAYPAADDARRLVAEARLGAEIAHPNLVGVLALDRLEDRLVVAMDLVRGPTLQQLLKASPLAGAPVVDLGRQVCNALEQLHGWRSEGAPSGVVHRDVKPSNLLVDPLGVVRLSDLGIHWVAGEDTSIAGTPGYMAPEQVAGRPEPRSDLYALGMTLATALLGRRPFGGGQEAIRLARCTEALPDEILTEVEAKAPGLAAVVDRCVRRDVEARWPSAEALGDALARIQVLQEGPTLAALVTQADERTASRATGTLTLASSIDTLIIPKGNLPADRTRFLGRTREVDAVCREVGAGQRLVTLLGPGGIGKTRTAIEAARRLSSEREGGAWFLDLADARSEDAVIAHAGRMLSVPPGSRDGRRQVAHAIRGYGPTIVILDNLEQVVAHVGPVLEEWAAVAQEASFVCTSRLPLRLPGERRLAVEPLSVDDGVALFVERSPRPLDARESQLLPEVVAKLDGLPLAIELAAARTQQLTLSEIRDRLGDRLRLLSEDSTERPARHRSLSACLDASWELLSVGAAQALSQLSIFEGAPTLAAAQSVLALPADAPWALDVFQELVDASLLRLAGEDRFGLLPTVREWAATRLMPADRAALELRHARWFRAERHRMVRVPDAADHEDLVAATERALAAGDLDTAADTGEAALRCWCQWGPFQPGLAFARRLLDRLRSDEARAEILLHVGFLARVLGRPDEATTAVEEALALARVAGDDRGEARALLAFARIEVATDERAAAMARLTAVIDLCRVVGDARLEASALHEQSTLHRDAGRIPEAERSLKLALQAADRSHGTADRGSILRGLALVSAVQGRLDEALERLEESVAATREVGDARGELALLVTAANIRGDQGRVQESVRAFREALQRARTLGERHVEGTVLGQLASLALHTGELETSRALGEQALELHRELGDRVRQGNMLTHLAALERVEERHEAALPYARDAVDLLRPIGHARFLGFALQQLGHALVELGRHDEAEDALAEALEVARAARDERSEALTLRVIGQNEHLRGRHELARERYVAAAAKLRGVGDDLELLRALEGLVRVGRATGDRSFVAGLVPELQSVVERLGADAAVDVVPTLNEAKAFVAGELD